jgi:hypothetical protein
MPATITKANLQERNALVSIFQQINFQKVLSIFVNYHVESIMDNIIEIIGKNTGQKKYLHTLVIPPGLDTNLVNISLIKIEAVRIIINILQSRFVDSLFRSDNAFTYIIVDWS